MRRPESAAFCLAILKIKLPHECHRGGKTHFFQECQACWREISMTRQILSIVTMRGRVRLVESMGSNRCRRLGESQTGIWQTQSPRIETGRIAQMGRQRVSPAGSRKRSRAFFVVIRASSSIGSPRISARRRAVSATRAGSLVRPRKGWGLRYGLSVSTRIRSRARVWPPREGGRGSYSCKSTCRRRRGAGPARGTPGHRPSFQ